MDNQRFSEFLTVDNSVLTLIQTGLLASVRDIKTVSYFLVVACAKINLWQASLYTPTLFTGHM